MRAWPPGCRTAHWRGPPAAFSVVLHDAAPATQQRLAATIALLERSAGRPLRFSLLVVPRHHGAPSTPGFEHWLAERAARGDELVLHGLTHRDDGRPRGLVDTLRRRFYTAGEGEFAALPAEQALARLREGLRWCRQRGWRPQGFVAPAWLLSEGAWAALRGQPLRYTCTRERLVRLDAVPLAWPSTALVWSTRAAWRRVASAAWNAALARRLRGAPWWRIELHPDDVAHALTRDSLLARLREALAAGRVPLTLRQAAACLE